MLHPRVLCLLPEAGPEAALVRDAVAGLEGPSLIGPPEPGGRGRAQAHVRAIVVGDLARLVAMGGGAVTPAALVPVLDATIGGPAAGISVPFLEEPAVVWVLQRPLDLLKVRAGLRHAVRWVALTEEASRGRAELARREEALDTIESLASIPREHGDPVRILGDGLEAAMRAARAPEGNAYLVEEGEARVRHLRRRLASGPEGRSVLSGSLHPIEAGSPVGEAALSGALRSGATDDRLTIAVPMLAPDGEGEKVSGVLEMCGAPEPLDILHARRALALARVTAGLIESSLSARGAEDRFDALALAAAAALEERGVAPRGHAGRVAALAVALGQALDGQAAGALAGVRLSSRDLGTLHQAAHLHLIARHASLDAIPWPPELALVPRLATACHAEEDATADPPLLARILRLCDRFDMLACEDPGGALGRLTLEARSGRLDADLLEILVNERLFASIARADAVGGKSGIGSS